jgi:type IV secretory pathway VirB2 component (pilin)
MAHALAPVALFIHLWSGAFNLNLKDFVTQLFNDVRDVAQIIAPIAAVIGFIGLGIMYMGSSWPLIGDWKRDNPKAANQVVIGLLFVVFAASVTTLITFTGS